MTNVLDDLDESLAGIFAAGSPDTGIKVEVQPGVGVDYGESMARLLFAVLLYVDEHSEDVTKEEMLETIDGMVEEFEAGAADALDE